MPTRPLLQGWRCAHATIGRGVLALAGAERLPHALGGSGAAGVDGELGVAALDEVLRVGAGEDGAAEPAPMTVLL